MSPGLPLTGPRRLEVLDELCERRAFVQLATPYLTFPAHALERQGEDLRLRVTLTQDFVTRTLGQQALRIRFPWGLGMAGGPVKVLGYQVEDGKRILTLKAPAALGDQDQRAALRAEPPTQGTATLNPDGRMLVRARVEDLSPLGLRLFALEPLNGAFIDGHLLQLSLGLELGPHLDAQARLVWQDGQTLGLVFHPSLPAGPQADLEAFLLPEVQAAQQRWDNRAALRAAAEARMKPKAAPEGVLLLGRDRALEAELRQALPGLTVRLCPPALAPLRDALEAPPRLILLHLAASGMQERFLFKALAEALPAGTPAVVLAAPGTVASARELAGDLKAATSLEWNPAQAVFLARLLQGLIRRRWGAEEA